MPAYALTIFISAFLLLQIQPLMGKYILPWFGGGPGVWTTCMVFFQVVLLGGYAYAHFTTRRLKARAQAVVHLTLLAGALALSHVTPSDSWKPDATGNPTRDILVLLTVNLGLPYLVLSATGPLLQQWFSRAQPGISPYRLYALSNVGSLLALISYPFYFEPHFTRVAQAGMWSWGFGAFVLGCGFCAVRLWRQNPPGDVRSAGWDEVSSRPSALVKLLWLLLPGCATVLLLATTNKMCQDVAVIPFLWILPLALYLLSFIICFDNPRWYRRPPFALALVAALAAMGWALFEGAEASLRAQVVIYSAGLLVCCWVCHGELYRLRPDPRLLTGYYLMISAGGALGGLFVALGAPLLFQGYFELHWGMLFCGLLFLIVCLRERTGGNIRSWRWLAGLLTLAAFGGLDRAIIWRANDSACLTDLRVRWLRIGLWSALALMLAFMIGRKQFPKFRLWRRLGCLWLSLGLVALAVALRTQVGEDDGNTVSRSRNFYGTLSVSEYFRSNPAQHYYLLQHGRITHGIQFVDPEKAKLPTSYYCEGSGVALAIHALPAGRRRIGVVGMGTGTITAFGRPGDTVRVYEINPAVRQLATTRFTYLSNCPAQVEVAMGDARLSLEREPAQQFDLLALDAFSSDAIPVHLLTREAFELYNRHMKPGGIIAVHVSNRHLNLEPVVQNLARQFKYQLAIINCPDGDSDVEEEEEEPAWWKYASTWILLTHDESILKTDAIRSASRVAHTNAITIPLWTDDFASIFQILE